MSDTIHFIITGGTIDSFYNGAKDTVETLKESAIPAYIKSLKLHEEVEFTTICLKDSREITKDDLTNLLKLIKESSHKKFIVTHGTYTMPDSARFLEANLGEHDKTIVFTGSMIPLTGFLPSDAPFNLGYSLAVLHQLGPGVKVCMNGKVFEPSEVMKVINEGRYDSIFNK
jgi:L-asparaginase